MTDAQIKTALDPDAPERLRALLADDASDSPAMAVARELIYAAGRYRTLDLDELSYEGRTYVEAAWSAQGEIADAYLSAAATPVWLRTASTVEVVLAVGALHECADADPAGFQPHRQEMRDNFRQVFGDELGLGDGTSTEAAMARTLSVIAQRQHRLREHVPQEENSSLRYHLASPQADE
jgi:hypothetical protein